jgi:hypothetical protein
MDSRINFPESSIVLSSTKAENVFPKRYSRYCAFFSVLAVAYVFKDATISDIYFKRLKRLKLAPIICLQKAAWMAE